MNREMTFSEYLGDRTAVSKHWLDLIERSPAHLKYYLENPIIADTTAFKMGRLIHCAVLTPDLISTEYAIKPDSIDRRTKCGKAEWEEFQRIVADREVITTQEMATANAVRSSLLENTKVAQILNVGHPEVTNFWHEPETGEKCKGRADWIHGSQGSLLVDLKTCEDASPAAFAKSVINYRYDVQAAHYCEGFDIDKFVFIAVEKKPPYAVALYVVDDQLLERGQYLRMKNLRTYSGCKNTGTWPAYRNEIQPLDIPAWAWSGVS